jgi:hypothetical protein
MKWSCGWCGNGGITVTLRRTNLLTSFNGVSTMKDFRLHIVAVMVAFIALAVIHETVISQELPPEYQMIQSPVIEISYRVVDLVGLEKRADYLLYNRSKLTAAERRALIRPKGAVDVARCVEILASFGLAELHPSLVVHSRISLQHTDTGAP